MVVHVYGNLEITVTAVKCYGVVGECVCPKLLLRAVFSLFSVLRARKVLEPDRFNLCRVVVVAVLFFLPTRLCSTPDDENRDDVLLRVGVGNAIFSRDPHSWHRCSGPEYLKEVVGPSKIPFFFRLAF